MLIAFMEQTSFELAQQYMKEGDTTVGVSVNIKHLKANLVGDRLKCISTLEKIDGKRLDFSVKVYHNENVVGEGEHSRFIVNEEKFLGKLKG
jgi:fluoroacetyl-CoA thioesterase